MYRSFGLAHAHLARLAARVLAGPDRHAPRERGQGTVEYVALILLVALVMAGVVTAMKGFKTDEGTELGDAIIKKIKDAVARVKF